MNRYERKQIESLERRREELKRRIDIEEIGRDHPVRRELSALHWALDVVKAHCASADAAHKGSGVLVQEAERPADAARSSGAEDTGIVGECAEDHDASGRPCPNRDALGCLKWLESAARSAGWATDMQRAHHFNVVRDALATRTSEALPEKKGTL